METMATQVLVKKLRTVQDCEQRDELTRAVEQASFCAFGYPPNPTPGGGKKSKTRPPADDHGTNGCGTCTLTWKRALLLAECFLPAGQSLPEFDTVTTCTADQELLLRRIVALVPAELDPKNRLDDIHDFVQVPNLNSKPIKRKEVRVMGLPLANLYNLVPRERQ